ncbi:MAG: dTDP-4-amino-4,6-dideoxygalactose transaminase [Candidatus Paceibacterota bacterium]|jgi:dTDP-4-amino-4,6-dideoxygalactose transaminase
MIPFNIPPFLGKEEKYIKEAIKNRKLCGDGPFIDKCNSWFEKELHTPKALLTSSCTHALEMAAILIDIRAGDEVILPSYTFSSTANAFILRGAMAVFIDIRPDTMNIDETLIEDAITNKTKAIVVVHYAGVACEMDKIMKIAKKYNLYVIEDAAQGVMSKYKGRFLGTIGDIGCYSFHESKNYAMGEGGAILIQNKDFIGRAEVIRDAGTSKAKFCRGEISQYTWVDIGSSYLPSELSAAYLYAQLEQAQAINQNRLAIWDVYYNGLKPLQEKGFIELPYIPKECEHNAHMFYIKCKDKGERSRLINHLKQNNICAVFHYIPLHSSTAGLKYGKFVGEDNYTTKESEKILRLPLYYNLEHNKVKYVIDKINEFYAK